jgi:hypothetical protein
LAPSCTVLGGGGGCGGASRGAGGGGELQVVTLREIGDDFRRQVDGLGLGGAVDLVGFVGGAVVVGVHAGPEEKDGDTAGDEGEAVAGRQAVVPYVVELQGRVLVGELEDGGEWGGGVGAADHERLFLMRPTMSRLIMATTRSSGTGGWEAQ